ncbi:Amastin surface glycoprotein [Novymonas esmeraldas]|uniref:Amastin surface glycoprotein n=1 Tax=Novymonas esmeraldas TaxID=1808958 RepID=A0AAW0ESV8_9TRYP
MQGQGNTVPQGHQPNRVDSGEGSYTHSSDSYTDSASVVAPPQQQQSPSAAPAASAQSPANADAAKRSRAEQQQQQQQTQGGNAEAEGKKGRATRGKEKVRTMMSTAFEAPVARVRAATDALVGRDSQRVTIYVLFCVAWIHLLFVILSSTLSQIDMSGGGCYTYWGFKASCDTVSYTDRTALIKNCNALRSSLQAGAAFSIFSILASTATVVTSWMLCSRLREAARQARRQSRYKNVDEMAHAAEVGGHAADSNGNGKSSKVVVFDAGQLKRVIVIIIAVSLACELICWAVIAGINTRQYCNDIYSWSSTATYGVGFGIGLTAWLIELLVFVVVIAVV